MNDADRPSEYVRRLPVGERLPLGDLLGDALFPFEGDLRVEPLQEPMLPEPERRGMSADECWSCREAGPGLIWQDERWRVVVDPDPHGLPMVAVLLPRTHCDLEDMPPEVAAELGTMIQRVARAVGQDDAIGRVHVNRWGDGSYHFHVWFLARPRGMWQMRGAMLAVWDDLLPKVPPEEWQASRQALAAALARDGGRALT